MLPQLLSSRIQDELDSLSSKGNLRQLTPPLVHCVDFCSNDYLGLSNRDPLLVNHNSRGIQDPRTVANRIGSGGSRLLAGNHDTVLELEERLGGFFAGSALMFSSGYLANIGLLATLPQRGDTILFDSLIHASLRDGIRLSQAKAFKFKHNCLIDLEEKLAKVCGQAFIVTEGLFSMDGDIAPLQEIAALCRQYQAVLIVDEAHSTGVYGSHGQGLCCSILDTNQTAVIKVHTFGKAMGAHGACVVGSPLIRDYLVNRSRPFIYTTAPSEHCCAIVSSNLMRLQAADLQRKQLWQLSDTFDALRQSHNLPLVATGSPIKALIIPGNQKVSQIAKACRDVGFDVRAIKSPTVKLGTERLRICLHSYNSEDDIFQLITFLVDQLEEIGRNAFT